MTFSSSARPPLDWGVVPDEALLDGEMRELFEYWFSKTDNGLPQRRDLRVGALAKYLPQMVILDPCDSPPDFKITYMGSEVVRRSREDRTGQRLRDVAGMAPGTRFWRRFEWMWQNRTPLFSEVEYVGGDTTVRHVHDLSLPVLSPDGRIECFFIYIHYVGFAPAASA